MNIERAKKLKYGQQVSCPADRGDPAFTGIVRSAQHDLAPVHKNLAGDEYIWVSVSRPGRNHTSVWPSNRLG